MDARIYALLAASAVLLVPAAYAAPSITAPPDITMEAEFFFTRVEIGVPAADPGHRISSNAPPFFPVGSTIITWMADDGHGGRTLDTQNVTITDSYPPACQKDAVSGPHRSETGRRIAVDVEPPRVRDVADISPEVVLVDGRDRYPVGNTTVTFAATDASGNTAECPVTVMVAIPDINLVLHPSPDSIRASWDGGGQKYKIVLYLAGEEIRSASTGRPGHVFSGLEPGTGYTVKVSLSKHPRVHAEASATTPRLLDIRDGLVDGWTHHATTLEPGFNRYVFTVNQSVGNPAPSAMISGDGENTSSRIKKWLDTSPYAGGPLYLGIDYMSGGRTLVQFVVDAGDGTARYVKSAWADGTWRSHAADISGAFTPGGTARVQIYLYDTGPGGHTIHLDNLVLSGRDPGRDPGVRGGSAGGPLDDLDASLPGTGDPTAAVLAWMGGR